MLAVLLLLLLLLLLVLLPRTHTQHSRAMLAPVEAALLLSPPQATLLPAALLACSYLCLSAAFPWPTVPSWAPLLPLEGLAVGWLLLTAQV